MQTKHHMMAASAVLVAFTGAFSAYNVRPFQANAAASAEATVDYAITSGFRACAQDIGRVSVGVISRDANEIDVFTNSNAWLSDDRLARSESDSLWKWGQRFEPIGIDIYQLTMEAVGNQGIEDGDQMLVTPAVVVESARAFLANPTERIAGQEYWDATQDMRRLTAGDRINAVYNLCLGEGRMFNYAPGAAARIVAADDLANQGTFDGTISVLTSLANPRAAIDARAAKLNPPIRLRTTGLE